MLIEAEKQRMKDELHVLRDSIVEEKVEMQASIDRLADETRFLEGEVSQKEALIVVMKGRMQSHAHALQVEYQIVATLAEKWPSDEMSSILSDVVERISAAIARSTSSWSWTCALLEA